MRYSNTPPSKGKPTGILRTKEQVAQDSAPIKFGQYRGKTWDYVAEINPQYIVWSHTEIKNRNAADLASMPLANWCGYVSKVQKQEDDAEGDLDKMSDGNGIDPEDDIPF